MNKSYRYT